MLALSDAINRGVIPNSEVVLVVSDKPAAAGLLAAQERGHKTIAIERKGLTREEHETRIIATLKNTKWIWFALQVTCDFCRRVSSLLFRIEFSTYIQAYFRRSLV
jgi:folate-dependent phosphoribosylglycinamide formyltransferase PurN